MVPCQYCGEAVELNSKDWSDETWYAGTNSFCRASFSGDHLPLLQDVVPHGDYWDIVAWAFVVMAEVDYDIEHWKDQVAQWKVLAESNQTSVSGALEAGTNNVSRLLALPQSVRATIG